MTKHTKGKWDISWKAIYWFIVSLALLTSSKIDILTTESWERPAFETLSVLCGLQSLFYMTGDLIDGYKKSKQLLTQIDGE